MRVLHLIDVAAPWGGPCTQRLVANAIARLRSGEWSEHDVLLIGTHADVVRSKDCGLQPLGSIWPLRGRTLSATRPLVRWLNAARDAGRAPDLVHGWSASAGALAAFAAGGLSRSVTIKPLAVDIDDDRMVRRDVIRSRWRSEHEIGEDEFVLGVLGEPAECFDARRAMHVGVRTGLSSRKIRMIMNGRMLGRAAQQRFLEKLDLDRVVAQDEACDRPWEMVRGLDAALMLAPADRTRSRRAGPLSSLPVLLAQAAGVPVIAEASAPLDNLIEHGHTGLLFPNGDLNTACDRLAKLHDHSALERRIAAAAQDQARRRHSLDRLCCKLHEAWRTAMHDRREIHLDLSRSD